MAKWEWKEDMYGLQQPFTIYYHGGKTVVDLTGLTPTLYVWDDAGLEFSLVGILDGDPTTGICYFTPIVTDFVVAGKYRFEIELTAGGKVIKTKDYIVECTDSRP